MGQENGDDEGAGSLLRPVGFAGQAGFLSLVSGHPASPGGLRRAGWFMVSDHFLLVPIRVTRCVLRGARFEVRVASIKSVVGIHSSGMPLTAFIAAKSRSHNDQIANC